MSQPEIEIITLNADDDRVARPENSSFRIKGNSGCRRGFLLVHGFTGSPWEMRPMARNFTPVADQIIGIRLPGHGTTPDDLAGKRYEEWLETVEQGYDLLQESCDEIIGVGLSTGALLLLAAAEKRAFQGLILLSPYLKMRQWLARFAGLLSRFIKYNRRPVDTEHTPYYYQDRPLAGVYQINRLIKRVSRNLRKVEVPILVASAAGDMTVDAESAIDLYNRLGSRRKEYYRFGKDVPHVLTTTDNPEQEEVMKITARFAAALTRNQAGSVRGAAA